MLKRYLSIFAVLGGLQAQQVVAPTTEQVGSPRGTDRDGYNITQSFELGYRFHTVSGDEGEYRTIANYGNGIRLFGTALTVNSKDGHGHYFDEILLNTSGLGNDPYESATLRVQKNGLYRYDMRWGLSDYYNPGLTIAGGYHFANTGRRLQDHELTLLPQGHFQFHLGYSRNSEDGPALSSVQEFNAAGSGYPIFTDVRRHWNEYRVGADAEYGGFKLTLLHRWDFFKDDTPAMQAGVFSPGTGTDKTVFQQFNRAYPLRGTAPGWLGNLHKRSKLWGMNARLTYVAGHNNFSMNELASGLDAAGLGVNRQIVVGGDATRPDLVGDLSVSYFPNDKLTITNNTSVSNNRIDGQSSYTEATNGINPGATLYFRFLGIRLITNSAEVNYRVSDLIGFYAGWQYADRQLRTIEAFDVTADTDPTFSRFYQVGNQEQLGRVGVRLHPWKPFTINLEGELGHANRPLTALSDKDFHTIGGRAQYRAKKLQMSASYKEFYNFNSNFSIYSAHMRGYTADAVWMPNSWLSLDASYNKLHNDASSFLAFFAGAIGSRPSLQFTYRSEYISNIHSGNLGVHLAIHKKADLYLGYNITKDTGDGRATAVPPGTTDPIAALLDSVQTYPLTYQSPLARLSIRVSPKLRWNAGYQFYNYTEQFGLFNYYQNFHAHTGYTSLLWSF